MPTVTVNTDNSGSPDYTTLAAAIAGEAGTTGDLEILLSGVAIDNTVVTISGMAATNILISGDPDHPNGWNKSNDPAISLTHYRHEKTTSFGYGIIISQSNVIIRGIQAYSLASSAGHPLNIASGAFDNVIVECNRLEMRHDSGAAFRMDGSGTGVIVRSNIINNVGANATSDDSAIQQAGQAQVSLYHNWFMSNDAGRGINDANNSTWADIANNVCTNNAEHIRNSSAVINSHNDNAFDTAAPSKLPNGAEINIAAGTDYVSVSDFRPRSGGKLDGTATLVLAPLDITGAAFVNSNIGPFNEVEGAAPAPAGFSYGYFVG